jgi:hypothetical protein
MYKQIGRQLHPERINLGGLSSVDIFAGSDQSFPYGPDPKTWTGPWHSITNPDQIARHVCAANHRQYHQANSTPFASEPLLSHFGFCGNLDGATSLLNEHLPPPEITSQLLPETNQILSTLMKPSFGAKSSSGTITKEAFSSLYKILLEATSSSPSGRHFGHYKVASTDEVLADLHSTMMSIPYEAGFSPTRWQTVIDIMLEKTQGDPKVHQLRIIAPEESDFNQSNRILLGRPLMHHLEDNHLIPDMQYGSRPGKYCHSAILNKQLTFEIIRLTKTTAAFIENDATGCYDRMVNPLLILCLRKLGANSKAVQSLAETWNHTIHYIKTKYGISSTSYKNSADSLLFGPGQGSTLGPFLWLLCFILIVNSINPGTPRLSHTSVDGLFNIDHFGDSFVDDTALGCTATNIEGNVSFSDMERKRRQSAI